MAKKKEIYFGKGFKRIYFVLAGLWIAIICIWFFNFLWLGHEFNKDMDDTKDFLIGIALPFVIYFILLFFIKGFKK